MIRMRIIKKDKSSKKSSGYTIIETMIAITVFLVVVMIGMGALLNANLIHNKSEDMRSIMDNISYIMEDISRNLRTGYDFRCVNDGNFIGDEPRSCSLGGKGIIFKSTQGGTVTLWAYKIEASNIYKSYDGGSSWSPPLNVSEVVLNPDSIFVITGAEPGPIDTLQPLAVIRLGGEIDTKGQKTTFNMETVASQRMVDRDI